jgi:hypothetical protein
LACSSSASKPPRSPPVAGVQIDVEQQRVGVGLERAQLGHVLGRLPVGHLAVVQRRQRQDGRVGAGFQVVVGAVGAHPAVLRLDLRVAPLDELLGGQRQALVEHGVDDVDEGHLHHHRLEELRSQVDHGAHQEAAGAAPAGDELRGRGPALAHQGIGAGDEVGEAVHLARQLAVQVPASPQVAATAHMRHGEDHAAVQQAQQRGVEARIAGDAVGAVAIEQQGLRSGAAPRLGVQQRDRHTRAIRGLGPDPLAGVAAGVVAGHRLHLADLARSPAQRMVDDRGRRGHRLVAEAQGVAVELKVLPGLDLGAVDRLVKTDVARRARPQRQHAQAQIAAGTHAHHQMAPEHRQALKVLIGPRRDQLAGRPQAAGAQRQADEAEVGLVIVNPQQQAVAVVLGKVLHPVATRQHAAPHAGGPRGVQAPDLAGVLGQAGQKELAAVGAGTQLQVEELVLLLEHQAVRRAAPHGVAPQLVHALGGVVRQVEQVAAVGAPLRRALGRALAPPGQVAGAVDVAHLQAEVARAGLVQRIGQQAAVRARLNALHPEEFAPLGESVEVQQQLFGRLRVVAPLGPHGPLAHQHRVLLARQRALAVPPAPLAHRHRLVGLLDARQHLLVELLPEGLERREPGLGVGRLGKQVGPYRRVVALAQPEPVVDPRFAVHRDIARLAGRQRGVAAGSGPRDEEARNQEQQQAEGGIHARIVRSPRSVPRSALRSAAQVSRQAGQGFGGQGEVRRVVGVITTQSHCGTGAQRRHLGRRELEA